MLSVPGKRCSSMFRRRPPWTKELEPQLRTLISAGPEVALAPSPFRCLFAVLLQYHACATLTTRRPHRQGSVNHV
jgi:hypothetical protein